MEVIYRNTTNIEPSTIRENTLLACLAVSKLLKATENAEEMDVDGFLAAAIEFKKCCILLGFLNCNDALRWLKIYGSFDI